MAGVALPLRSRAWRGLTLALALSVTPFVPAAAIEVPKEPTATKPADPNAQPPPTTPAPTPPSTPPEAPTRTPPATKQPPAQPPAETPPSGTPDAGKPPAKSPEAPKDAPKTPATKPDGSPAEGPVPAAATPAAADRGSVYKQFRDDFVAGRFADALPRAEQVVSMTEARFGPESAELITPLVNVGTTQMRLNNFYAAETAYRRALRIAESREGGYSRTVIAPLHGLGLAQHAGGQFDNASQSLRRAVDVSRKIDGLFNIQQLPLVEALVESYIALDKTADVDREQQYALRLSETAYGKDDPRMLPVLERNAGWCESTGRYRMARQAHARSLEILGRTAGKRDPAVVTPLRGIARTYKLEFLYGTAEQDPANASFNPQLAGNLGGMPQTVDTRTARLDGDGEAALRLALSVLEERPDQVALRGETLLDLGDWYQLGGKTYDATRVYKDAWAALSAPGGPGTAAMSEPSQLYYKPPSSAAKRADKDDDEQIENYVEVEFTVTPEGRVVDTRTVATDGNDAQDKSVQIALRRARYRPRFVEGSPVATKAVRHRQVLYTVIPTTNRSAGS